jgi:hypothetical protein
VAISTFATVVPTVRCIIVSSTTTGERSFWNDVVPSAAVVYAARYWHIILSYAYAITISTTTATSAT